MLMFFIILRKQATCWGKIWIVSYCLKFSQQIRLQDSLILYLKLFLRLLSKEGSISDYIFYLAVTSSAFYPIEFLDSLIFKISRKNQVISFFWHGFNHQENIASEVTTFHWVQSGVFCGQSDSGIFWSSVSGKNQFRS